MARTKQTPKKMLVNSKVLLVRQMAMKKGLILKPAVSR